MTSEKRRAQYRACYHRNKDKNRARRNARARARFAALTDAEREKHNAKQREDYRRHRKQRRARHNVYRQAHQEQYREYDRKRYRRVREERCAARRTYCRKHPQRIENNRLKAVYGITLKDYRRLVREQRGRCAICGLAPKKLFIDHCHKTGDVRGLLCAGCNSYLGRIKDSPRTLLKAIKYLQRPLPSSFRK